MMNAIVSINKPTGLTSSDVVVRVRKILYKKLGEKIKVGHMGTLDPGASGVLLLGVGKSTRLFDYFQKKNKVYIGRLTFSTSTDTLDSYGKIISSNNIKPSYDSIKAKILNFIGEIEQIPPKYSAIKINGQKAYQLARLDKDVILNTRKIIINDIKIIRYSGTVDSIDSVDLLVDCSSGTYIRTLFNDIAKSLETIGYMSYLIRTKLGIYNIEESITLEEYEKDPLKYMLNPIDYIKTIMPIHELNNEEFNLIKSGRDIKINIKSEYVGFIFDGKLKFIAKNEQGVCKSITNLE